MKYNEFLYENIILNEYNISDLWNMAKGKIKDILSPIKQKIINKLYEYFSDCASKNIEDLVEPIKLDNGDEIESKEIVQYILWLYKNEIKNKSIKELVAKVFHLDEKLISSYYNNIKHYKSKEEFLKDLNNIENVTIKENFEIDEAVLTKFALFAKMCFCLVVAPVILTALEPSINDTQAYSQEYDYNAKNAYEMEGLLHFLVFEYDNLFGYQSFQKKYTTKLEKLETNIQKLKKMNKNSAEYKELIKQTNIICNGVCSKALEDIHKKDNKFEECKSAKEYYLSLRSFYKQFFVPQKGNK